jgi:ferric-dicitrate binding protein FerR (iron transport regulator)
MNLALSPFAAFTGLLRQASIPPRPVPSPVSVTGAVAIARKEVVVVRDAAQTQVACLRGSLWITHDRDVRDIVISAGESHTSDRPGLMLVYGLRDSVATIG